MEADFLNREWDLNNLIENLSVDDAALINMYGRRRLGKTEQLLLRN